jgi:hypothetical protein
MTVDSKPYARFEADGTNTLYVNSLQNERLFVAKEMALPSLVMAGVGQSSGRVRYLQ